MVRFPSSSSSFPFSDIDILFFSFFFFSSFFPFFSGLEVDLSMANAPVGSHSTAEKEQDELSERLAKLRNMDN